MGSKFFFFSGSENEANMNLCKLKYHFLKISTVWNPYQRYTLGGVPCPWGNCNSPLILPASEFRTSENKKAAIRCLEKESVKRIMSQEL